MDIEVLGIVAPHPPIMVHEVGGEDSDQTSASEHALRALGAVLRDFAPDVLVLVSPHAHGYFDAFTITTAERLRGDLGQFNAPRVEHHVAGDPELAREIIADATEMGVPVVEREGTLGSGVVELDHGALVPLHFLDPDAVYPLLEVSFSGLSASEHRTFGRVIANTANRLGRKVALIASGDMSHRLLVGAPAGYSPRAHEFDEAMVTMLGRADFDGIAAVDPDLREMAGECGWRSLLILGGFLEGSDAQGRVLSYEGPWGVGYLTALFAAPELPEGLPAYTPPMGSKGGMPGSIESEPVALARATIEAFVSRGEVHEPTPLTDPALPARAGAFVSLHTPGGLRGCIGTIGPTQDSLAAEIVHNAIQAASQDPRFPPVRSDELASLEITVDVLEEPEPVSSLEELDPKVYGVITTCGWKRGLLLPDLEGVDTCEDQVAIAMSKAGIAASEPISLERFKVVRYA